MKDFFPKFREKVADLDSRKKILLSLTLLILIISLAFLLTPKKEIEKGRGQPIKLLPSPKIKPVVPQKPQSLPQLILDKISQLAGIQKQEKSQPLPSPKLEKTVATNEIANATLDYLDSQKRPDGFYNFYPHYEDVCQTPDDLSTCPLAGKNFIEQTNMWTILARLSFYQNFLKDPKDLEKAEEDAQNLLGYCDQDLHQCMATVVAFDNLYKQTQNFQYRQLLKNLGQLLINESYEQNVMSLAIQAQELARLNQLFPDDEYLKIAYQRLYQAENTSSAYQARYGGVEDEACYLVQAQVALGQAGNDQDLLNKAVKFFKENKAEGVPEQVILIAPCIESAFELGNFLNDESIKSQAKAWLEKYVTERWDGPNLGGKYQEGGFFMGEDKSIINITDTAYMLYLLGFEPEKDYEFVYEK